MKEYSFSKAERLLNSTNFSRVIKDGFCCGNKKFTIYILKNSLNRHRLGLAVSARVANGPGRVRIKRLLREFFRLNKKRLFSLSLNSNNATYIQKKDQFFDIVISAKRAAGKEYGSKRLIDIEGEILQLFDNVVTKRLRSSNLYG